MRLALTTLCIASGLLCQAQTDCKAFNAGLGPYPLYYKDGGQHLDGQHDWTNVTRGTCEYAGTATTYVSTKCALHVTASSATATTETGRTTIYWHTKDQKDLGGATDAPLGGTAVADAEGAGGVNSCTFLPCGFSTSITGSGHGGGFSVSYGPTPSPYWHKEFHYTNSICPGHTLSPLPPPSGSCPSPTSPPPYGITSGSQSWSWNTTTCSWVLVNTNPSPIVVDTKGNGFRFSDVAKGKYVTFDIRGDGKPTKVSWPKLGSGNMWLALPDENGQVTSGKQLFGNYSPHSDGGQKDHPNPNGFLALDWWDAPDQGGNGNLIMDPADKVWSRLRLWDATRCLKEKDTPCVSRPEELYSLQSKGVYSISLLWDLVSKMPAGTEAAVNKDGSVVYGNLGAPMDIAGNQYRYKSVLNPEAENTEADVDGTVCCELHRKTRDGRWAIDVYLQEVQ